MQTPRRRFRQILVKRANFPAIPGLGKGRNPLENNALVLQPGRTLAAEKTGPMEGLPAFGERAEDFGPDPLPKSHKLWQVAGAGIRTPDTRIMIPLL